MKKYFILAAAAITLVACNQKEMENDGVQEPKVINLTASINSGEDVTRASSANALQNTAFVIGKEIFVEAYETGELSTYTSGVYTTAAGGALNPTPDQLYYPADNGAIDICAYYPKTINSDSDEFTVSNAQTSEANYQASDLMYATKLTNKSSASGDQPHNLTFNHALAKIVVNIVAGDGLTDANITTAPRVTAVYINHTVREASLSISGGAITASKKTTGSPAPSASNINILGTGLSNEGIIVPQTVAAGTFITVVYNGDEEHYTYALSEPKTFVAGKVYTYTLTLKARSVELTATTITDWDPQTGGTKDITI